MAHSLHGPFLTPRSFWDHQGRFLTSLITAHPGRRDAVYGAEHQVAVPCALDCTQSWQVLQNRAVQSGIRQLHNHATEMEDAQSLQSVHQQAEISRKLQILGGCCNASGVLLRGLVSADLEDEAASRQADNYALSYKTKILRDGVTSCLPAQLVDECWSGETFRARCSTKGGADKQCAVVNSGQLTPSLQVRNIVKDQMANVWARLDGEINHIEVQHMLQAIAAVGDGLQEKWSRQAHGGTATDPTPVTQREDAIWIYRGRMTTACDTTPCREPPSTPRIKQVEKVVNGAAQFAVSGHSPPCCPSRFTRRLSHS